MSEKQEKQWIKELLPAAQAAARCYGYLVSVMLGQASQETGYGIRPLVRYKNVLGVKKKLLPYASKHWDGRVIETGTWEEIDGEHVDKDDVFRVYDTYEQCFMDYCQFMRDGELAPGKYKYRDVLKIKDPETLIRTVNARGYATDQHYADAVLDIIKKHNLTQYDLEVKVHYISNCGHDEHGQYSGGAAGDQTGAEWEIKPWYSRPWDVVLEPPTRQAADTIAELAIEAANNNKIGYDQSNRTSFDAALIACGDYPKNITEPCETDCSAGVAAIVRATGRILGIKEMQDVSKDAYTGNLEKALAAAGFISHREEKYLTGPDYLGNGWILLYTGHHTAVSVSRGSKWEEKKVVVTRTKFLNGIIKTAQEAYTNKWTWGDSHTWPPSLDGLISCDRLVSRTLARDFGIEQKRGGWNSAELAIHLPEYGFKKTTNKADITPGTVVMIGKGPDQTYHTEVVERYDPKTGLCDKIDLGSTDRIRQGGYFKNVPLCEWSDRYPSVFFVPASDPAPAPKVDPKECVKEGQQALNKFFGAGLKVDGDRRKLTETAFVKAFQMALNRDFYGDGPMPVNGKLTQLTRAGLGDHFAEFDEERGLVTIVEIGMLLAGKNAGGVEYPGHYGTNLEACTGKKIITAEDIWKLFRPELLKD